MNITWISVTTREEPKGYLYMSLHLNKRYWYFDSFFSEGQDSSAVKWDRTITLITLRVVLNVKLNHSLEVQEVQVQAA